MLGAFVLPDDKLLALTFEHVDWNEAGQPAVQQALWFDQAGNLTRREEVRTAARSATGPVATSSCWASRLSASGSSRRPTSRRLLLVTATRLIPEPSRALNRATG